jgi:hypothetical protein
MLDDANTNIVHSTLQSAHYKKLVNLLLKINVVAFTRTSAIYYISIASGLFVTVALDCSFWCALQAEPEFPWKVFPLTLFFLSAYNLVFTIGFINWLIGTIIFFLEITGYTITRLGLSKNNMGIKKARAKNP